MSQVKCPITATVITFNEEANIERCLRSLVFCDEIIVVDSGSTDRTREIATRFTDKVFTQEWTGFAGQKNIAVQKASHPWVLSLDADEVATEALQKEIKELFVGGSPAVAAYSIPRKTIHFGRWIRHGGWYPNRLVRLFAKDSGRWQGEELHEKWVTAGVVGMLQADLEHYSFSSLSDQVARNNQYSSLGAAKLKKQGAVFSVVRLVTKPASKFLETYLIKKGFLDGFPGLIISVSAAYSVFLKWAKLWELERAHAEG